MALLVHLGERDVLNLHVFNVQDNDELSVREIAQDAW